MKCEGALAEACRRPRRAPSTVLLNCAGCRLAAYDRASACRRSAREPQRSRADCRALLVAQGCHGVDAGGAARWHVPREQRRRLQDCDRRTKRHWIARFDAIQERRDVLRSDQRAHRSQGRSGHAQQEGPCCHEADSPSRPAPRTPIPSVATRGCCYVSLGRCTRVVRPIVLLERMKYMNP